MHLVRERRLDIATVPLATVAQQYFDYIALVESLDVEIAADYLVIASTLVFLKSRSLLPAIPNEFLAEGEESADDVEERLRRRLVAYSTYKEAANALRARRTTEEAYRYREGGDATTHVAQRYRIAPEKLVRALLAAVRAARPEKRVIARERFSIARQMDVVSRAVRAAGSLDFVAFCHDLDRGGIIATFLAILELIRQRRLGYEQDAPDAPLLLLPFAAEEILAN